MTSVIRIVFSLLMLGCLTLSSQAQSHKERYFNYVLEAAQQGWEAYPDIIANWKANVNPSELWGYNTPAQPIYLADIFGFLYEETGDEAYAQRAVFILSEYGDLRETYPEDYRQSRAEYIDGIPSLANFFFLPPYLRAYLRIQKSSSLNSTQRLKIERDLAHSLDFVFFFPEWGAHNRAMLRAEGLFYGALSMPHHPHASKWRQMAETIASDNLRQWEIEDASVYQPVWLTSLFSYAEKAGDEGIFTGPVLRYYAEYLKQLITPARTMPDYGDANWNPNWHYFTAVFERLATVYRDPELKWAAENIFEKAVSGNPTRSVGAASMLALAHRWTSETILPRQPTTYSTEVLDDVVGKKIVFRNGWEPESTYLFLNYRDEGDGGYVHREFLRNTLSVEEEKMHHGHSDEQNISLLMSGRSVLLHDGGYRDDLPSGPYGGYRADYFHNRLVVRKNKRDTHQTVPEFIRNSGAYRPMRTQKVDFLTFRDVDFSRTRLVDEPLGYDWDRLVVYIKPSDFFIVVDAIQVRQTDFYTFTNLWHTQTIHEKGPFYYDTSIDSIGSIILPQEKNLLVQFLANEAKTDSFYIEQRHSQVERAIYQTISSHYRAGDVEVFVTALVPHDRSASLPPLLDRIRLVPVSTYPQALAIEISQEETISMLCLKLDLNAEVVRENIRPRYTWEAGKTRYGEFESDAHFLYATVRDHSIHWAASEVLKVLYSGLPLMEALPNTHGLQLDGAGDRVGYVKWRYWEDTFSRKE